MCDLLLDTFAYNLYSFCMGIRLKIFGDTDKAPQTVTQLPLQPHLCPLAQLGSPTEAAVSTSTYPNLLLTKSPDILPHIPPSTPTLHIFHCLSDLAEM